MRTPLDLPSLEVLDLHRHTVLEASAGTGKTWVIEHLVPRLVLEAGVRMEQLLVVTFTEKATGELVTRLRENLERDAAKAAPGEGRDRLEEALRCFDQAELSTLHGFCNTVLGELGFETGSPLEQELADDGMLLDNMLRTVLREHWPRLYGDELQPVLEFCGPRNQTWENWLSRVKELCLTYVPEAGDLLLPAPLDEQCLCGLRETLVQRSRDLAELLGRIDLDNPEASDFARHFSALPERKNWLASRLDKAVVPLLVAVGRTLLRPDTACRIWRDYLETGGKPLAKPFSFLIPEAKRSGLFQQVANAVEALTETVLRPGRTSLELHTLRAALALLSEEKQRASLLSYSDMLSRLRGALCSTGAGAEALRRVLRRRFRYAIIDEFQDTDAVQWAIFRSLFLDDPDQTCRLVVVGDPKQAIYGFRGADLAVYDLAVAELVESHAAQCFRLPTNHRSSAALVAAVDQLVRYPEAPWFEGYPGVKSGDSTSLETSDDNRTALNLLALPADENVRILRGKVAAFLGNELVRLFEARPMLVRRDERRPLGLGEVAVLVRSRRDALWVEEALTRRGIPWARYQQQGLFAGREALWLHAALDAALHPTDPAKVRAVLATPLIGLPLEQVCGRDLPPSDHPLSALLQTWSGAVSTGSWPRLFRSLLVDSGFALRAPRCASLPDWERSLTTCEQILAYLGAVAEHEGLSPRGLLDRLDGLIAGRSPEANALVHRRDGEEAKVQILTIHAAKGLEFAVVFLTLATDGRNSPYQRYHLLHDGQLRRVLDLDTSRPNLAAASEELAEFQRLYYVACTRAAVRLYLPYLLPNEKGGFGRAVSTLAFLHRSTGALASQGLPSVTVLTPLAENPRRWTAPPVATGTTGAVPEAVLPAPPNNPSRRPLLTSFSGLAAASRESLEASDSKLDPLEERAAIAPGVIPPGTATGLFFHHLFEHADFRWFAQEGDPAHHPPPVDLDTWIGDEVTRRGLVPRGKPREDLTVAASAILRRALRTPLGEDRTILCRLAPEDRLTEVEFHFPLPPGGRRGWVHGFIDLLFRYRGPDGAFRYGLVDWKTNLVEEGYGAEALQRYMKQHAYVLQHHLYTLAALRHLALVPGFKPEDHFAGSFYLFLRGLDDEGQAGVFHTAEGQAADNRETWLRNLSLRTGGGR